MSGRSRAFNCLLSVAALVTGLAVAVVPPAAPAQAALAGEAVTLPATFRLVRSSGARVEWSRYAGTSAFDRYEVHRSASSAFSPSASTLLTTIRDRDVTSWQDGTARAGQTFYYKVLANGAASNEVAVGLPAAGQARLTLQPDPREGRMARLYTTANPTGCNGFQNDGATTTSRLGVSPTGVLRRPVLRFNLTDIPVGATVSSATLTTWYPATATPQRQVDLHRVTADWVEGTGGFDCLTEGVSWLERQRGIRWRVAGGDVDSTRDAYVPAKSRSAAGSDSFDVRALTQKWANGTPNFGMLLKWSSETPGTVDEFLDYHSDDVADPALRPRLQVLFADGSAARAPRVAVSAPTADSTVRGSVTLTASAGDDRRVEKVEFFVNGVSVATDMASPWSATWASTGTGARDVTAKATDDVGNVTTSAPVRVTADNTAVPTVTLTSPPTGALTSPTVSLAATAGDDVGVARVEFYADDLLIGTDTSSPYTHAWNTLDLLDTAFDGAHVLSAKAVDVGGQVSAASTRPVTVANTAGKPYKATYDLNAPGPADDAVAVPPAMVVNEYAPSVDPTDPGGGGRNLASAPVDGTEAPGGAAAEAVLAPRPPGAVSANAFRVDVTVTNTSAVAWKGGDLRLWYRWYTPTGVVLFEGPGSDSFPQTVQPGASKKIPVTVEPPPPLPGTDLAQVRLRFDIYDTGATAANRWFGGLGNPPVDNPVIVNRELRGALGLERFWQYDAQTAGAGMSTLTNVANGNMLLRYSPMFAPGRGLATMLDLTYNSLEDRSDSPAGNNFSLSMSGLTRFGNGLDIHPNKADEISGKSNKYVVFTDGDGTTHTFLNGITGADGITRFTEPAGVNLYLRAIPTNPTNRRWAVTRPDKVTFYYDVDGFPTAVVDRNGNTMTFVLEATPPGEDPGGPKKRIIRVTDAGGRSFTVSYYSKAEAKKAHVRGNVKSITDHDGSALDFEYYHDGNLRKLIQRGGVNADGTQLADRTFVFTYTTSNGVGPAITSAAARLDPDPHTPNQSTRIYSVRDPRSNTPDGVETTFAYYVTSDANGVLLRWKLKSRTDREGQTTLYEYDPFALATTVKAPLARNTTYRYDTAGRVIAITNPLNQVTDVSWSSDNKVMQVTEPSGRFTRFAYNANGYPTSQTNQAGETTDLTYFNSGVDSGDTGQHLSLLATVTRPKGTVTATPGDFQWSYSYDAAGNVDRVTDPTGAVTRYVFNLAGSAHPGTVAAIHDANGNAPTTFPAYDPSGQPAKIVDPLGNTTQFGYDVDGRVRWIQDPNHAGDSGPDERAYKTFLDYDSFGRLGRQSAPKSTATDRGMVIWSGALYDPNDNVVRQVQPHFAQAAGDDPIGPTDPTPVHVATATYDRMDRTLLIANPDTSVDPAGERTRYTYDAGGRLSTQEQPKGVLTATANDYRTAYAYDALDRVIRETVNGTDTSAGQTRITHLCYDVPGDLRSVTSPRANLATLTCPGNGPATAAFTATYTYDDAHRQLTSTDPLGHVSRTTYDDNGNVETTDADIDPTAGRKALTTTTYDQRDAPIKTVQRFDGARAITNIIEYDRNGNRLRMVSPRGTDSKPVGPYSASDLYVTSFTYDAADRMSRVELPHDGRDGTERQYVHHSYDRNGNIAWSSLPVTSSAAASVQDSARTVMTYFDAGWIRTSDDPTNPKATFDYTAQGWQASRVADGRSTPGVPDPAQRMTWVHFADGLVKDRTDNGQQANTYEYDANNNLLKATNRGVSHSEQMPVDIEGTYTGFNETAKVRHRKQGGAVWTFSDYQYDANGNVTQRRENGEENDAGTQSRAPRVHTMTYDAADWLATQHDLGTDNACKDDQRIVNAFFASGWEKQRELFRAGAGCSTVSTTWPKRQTTSWTHFDNGQLRTLKTTAHKPDGTSQVTEQHDVSYIDAGIFINGHRVSDRYVLTRAEGNGASNCLATSPCDAKYTYDARDKLISHQLRAGRVDTYTLDEPANLLGDTTIRGGNVTTEVKKGVTTTKRYTANQLTEISTGGVTGKYWYNDQGSIDCLTLAAGSQANCSPSDGATPSGNLITDYAYDYLERLSGISQYAGGSRTDQTTYVIDAVDRTATETEDHGGSANDRTTTFTYQGLTNQTTEEKQTGGDNPRTRTFSYDAYGHRLSMTDTATGSTAEPDKYTYGRDVHSSVSQLIDDTGKVKASYGYDAYGGADAPPSDPQALTTGDTNNLAPINPYRYASRRMDSGTASSSATPSPVPNGSAGYDMGARRYGPDTGGFVQQDMFASAVGNLGLALDPLTQNRYALAGGNPISYIEIDGHASFLDQFGDAIKETAQEVQGIFGEGPKAGENTPEWWDQGLQTLADLQEGSATNVGADKQEQKAAQDRAANSDLGKILGLDQAKKCDEGSVSGCLWTAANFVPVGRIAQGAKALKGGDELADAINAACSFSGETRVLMADGTTKAISQIKVGDMVIATDPKTGKRGPRKVTHLWIHQDQVFDLDVGGHVVTTTEDHPFWNDTDRQWVRADQLDAGDTVLSVHGGGLRVRGLRPGTVRTTTAYNLTVDGIHTYYVLVGSTPILVHNTCGPRPDVPGIEQERVFGSLDDAVSHAEEWAGLGDDAVPHVQKLGPFQGFISGRMSPTPGPRSGMGVSGWRLDWDDVKGVHVNWWDHSGGSRRASWLYGANKVPSAVYDDYIAWMERLNPLD